ncbi:MAG: hypothetical protein CVT64_00955 [Actinobacteria bacterium HGW-Actinobacteria-4]|nr:MAG: hypothetical protein CVT64_00955 [Actinobacteria bacterium HGW-Actinobacteria-4]
MLALYLHFLNPIIGCGKGCQWGSTSTPRGCLLRPSSAPVADLKPSIEGVAVVASNVQRAPQGHPAYAGRQETVQARIGRRTDAGLNSGQKV